MNLAEYKARRAAMTPPRHRQTCPRCRKAAATCYCHLLRPFRAPVPFVILQHEDEARNPIATARMAHLSMTNARLVVDLHFEHNSAVNELLAAPGQRNFLLFPSRDAQPLDELLATDGFLADPRPPAFWILDAKWAQVPKMLRLSPNVRSLPRVKFNPEGASAFRMRRQPRRECVSTLEAIFLVIERVLARTGSESKEHQALQAVFQHFVRQQMGFVEPGKDTRHQIAKALRAERRQKRCGGDMPGGVPSPRLNP